MFKKNGKSEQIGKPLSLEEVRKKEQEAKKQDKAKDNKQK